MKCLPRELFASFDTLESITLPDSITEIGSHCFLSSKALKEITLPKNLSIVGKDAFYDCVSLTRFDLPDHISEVAYTSFGDVELWVMLNTIMEASLLREGIPLHVYDVQIPVDSIQLNATDKTMVSGTTYHLLATIAPSNANLM